MKFYPLSYGVMSSLLSGREVDLPMRVTDEQREIILSREISFIIGRSGTGKTTVLTMKLLENHMSFLNASNGISQGDGVLRQLFVTVSPRLCHAVKQHISHLISISCNKHSSVELNDIPQTFVKIPEGTYPLVITFHQFILMLDATLGDSFFDRLVVSHGNKTSSQEVTFERFCSAYWPHFSSDQKKKLDPSRVFTEIISHIKGGLQAGECNDGKLSCEGYCLLAESRSSTLTKQKRENVYSLFQAYEKMKSERGEFDLGDIVNYTLHRLKNGKYQGDIMDFVYIDEVQDLSMRQTLLFKYICQNVVDGFIFAGDTAQTIARGIDFRFQDIRSLFYNEFLSSTQTPNGKQEKGRMSEIKQLKQNFRTHAGVLDLAQSVIELLYHYFANSIDKLEPETSLISGEAPVLLESGRDENAIDTIFGDGQKNVGFGADQVILVRDEDARKEVCGCVGTKALVLTILECKGLEFEDVLLYNFFGTSPLEDKWRVLYGYMTEMYEWLDTDLPWSSQPFNEARHSVLCSELKQLYVAITRTRQRLWFCESREDLSRPMFDYWKKRGLVQVRKLDDSLAQAMQVASSPQEWLERGKKLFYENNFVMATVCFERAGDTTWEKLAKAYGLKASADQMLGTNSKAFTRCLREAAQMFESIGKLESAASCYTRLGEYETAGKIYMYEGEKLDVAAQSFTLAGCYSNAAAAYSKGHQFSKCLSVCQKQKLFNEGLCHIKSWKEENNNINRKEVDQFLESCALDYHRHKDVESMMKFVMEISCMESKRVFLRSLGCLDELLLLEEESGHFDEAGELASSWGYIPKAAHLFEKAGNFPEAIYLLCWWVLLSSLWGVGNRGWPLKQFVEKEKLCNKAISLAKMESEKMYQDVCFTIKVLSHQDSNLPELNLDLLTSQKKENASLREAIFLIRKILDIHLQPSSKYMWEEVESPIDIVDMKKVSVRTLVFYWNLWKANIVEILESLDIEEPKGQHFQFSLLYFGVREQHLEGETAYLIVKTDADWVRKCGQKGLRSYGKGLTCDGRVLVSAMRTFWQLELLSVGIQVLQTLEDRHKSKSPAFHQSTCLLKIFEICKFLLDCKYLNLTQPNIKKLQFFRSISTNFNLVFPLDWRNGVSSKDSITLRKTALSVNLLEEIMVQGHLTNSTLGRVMMIFLDGGVSEALLEEIIKKLEPNHGWKPLFKSLRSNVADVALELGIVLQGVLNGMAFRGYKWMGADNMSPHCFAYLVEHLIIRESFSSGLFFTTRSCLVRSIDSTSSLTLQPSKPISINTRDLITQIVEHILMSTQFTLAWIKKSDLGSDVDSSRYHGLLLLRMFIILSLLVLKEGSSEPWYFNTIQELLSRKANNIADLLPANFVSNLLRLSNKRDLDLEVIAQAFSSVDDPLLIVWSGNETPNIHAPCAIFVNLKNSEEDIMSLVFARKNTEGVKMIPVCWHFLDDMSTFLNDGKNGEHLSVFFTQISEKLMKNLQTLRTVEDGNSSDIIRDAINDLMTLETYVTLSKQGVDHTLFFKDMENIVKRLIHVRQDLDVLLKGVTQEESQTGESTFQGKSKRANKSKKKK